MRKDYHEQFMAIALESAEQAFNQGFLPVGTVAVLDDGSIVSIASKGSDYQIDHAEQLLLRTLRQNQRNIITLYTTLEPCLFCLCAAIHCCVPCIVYAMEDPYGGGITTISRKNLPEFYQGKRYPDTTGGILRDQSKAILKKFFQGPGRKHWNLENPLVARCFFS